MSAKRAGAGIENNKTAAYLCFHFTVLSALLRASLSCVETVHPPSLFLL
jgi:hypothetical protein